MKTKKTLTACAAMLLCGLFLLVSCGQPKYDWKLQDLGEGVNFHTAAQTAYLSSDDYTKISANGTQELSRPNAVRFEWSATAQDKNAPEVKEYVLEISTASNFSDCVTYRTSEEYFDVYNLYIATDYYWRVTAELSDGKKSVSAPKTFSTDNVAPRNIYVDGITNVRDLGGWETADGSRVKQGMIYRCGRLNTSEQPTVNIEITEKGIDTMLNELGIRAELDLRNPAAHNTETGGITSSPLGNDVFYYNCAMEWEGVSNLLTDSKNVGNVKEVFSVLADKNNYPIIYHCNIGTDRTGLFAFLINGLMGVSEDDLYRDYLFSNFGKINNTRTLSGIQNSYVKTIKSYPGATLSEKIKNCLIDLGVPAADIDAVCDIMSA